MIETASATKPRPAVGEGNDGGERDMARPEDDDFDVRNRLLVIDDEAGICDLIKTIAEDIGFSVVATGDPGEFRATFRAFEPTVIVLDLVMPEADGVELLRFLATQKCDAAIVLASGVDVRVLSTARRLGAAHGLKMMTALEKPFDVAALRTALRGVFRAERDIGEDELASSIAGGNLVVHYQPKLSLVGSRTWSIEQAEALVRLDHPGLGLLAPDRFIPLAERTGLISPLTDAVIDAALAQLGAWAKGGFAIGVSVNLAAQVLGDLSFPDRLAGRLAAHAIDPRDLILEITESAAMADTARTMDILTRCRLKGIGLSVDDFGTGYSSLVELYRMPFNELKIDRSLVIEVDQSDEARIIVRTIVDLAHNLGLSVCAEGTEDNRALDIVRHAGCERAQGYFVSRPLPAGEFEAFVRRWNAFPPLPDAAPSRA